MNNGIFDFKKRLAFIAALAFVSHSVCVMPAAEVMAAEAQTAAPGNTDAPAVDNAPPAADIEDSDDSVTGAPPAVPSTESDSDKTDAKAAAGTENAASSVTNDSTDAATLPVTEESSEKEYRVVFDNIGFKQVKENNREVYYRLLKKLFGNSYTHSEAEAKNEIIVKVAKSVIPEAADYEYADKDILFRYNGIDENDAIHYAVYYKLNLKYSEGSSAVPETAVEFKADDVNDKLPVSDNGENLRYYCKAGATISIVPSDEYIIDGKAEAYPITINGNADIIRTSLSEDTYKLEYGSSSVMVEPRKFRLKLASPDYYLIDMGGRYLSGLPEYYIKWKDIGSLRIVSGFGSKKDAFEIQADNVKKLYETGNGVLALSVILDNPDFRYKKDISLNVSGVDNVVKVQVNYGQKTEPDEEYFVPVKIEGENKWFEVPYLSGDGYYLEKYEYSGAETPLKEEMLDELGNNTRFTKIKYENDVKTVTLLYKKFGSDPDKEFEFSPSENIMQRSDNCYTLESMDNSVELIRFDKSLGDSTVVLDTAENGKLAVRSYTLNKNGGSMSLTRDDLKGSSFILVRNLINTNGEDYTDSLENSICFYQDRTAPEVRPLNGYSDAESGKWYGSQGPDIGFEISDNEKNPFENENMPYYDSKELKSIYDDIINADTIDKRGIASVIVGNFRFDRPEKGWSDKDNIRAYIETAEVREAEAALMTMLYDFPFENISGNASYANTYGYFRELLRKDAEGLGQKIDDYYAELIYEEKSRSTDSGESTQSSAVKEWTKEREAFRELFSGYAAAVKAASAGRDSVPSLSFDPESGNFSLHFKAAAGKEKSVIREEFEVKAVDNSNNISSRTLTVYVNIDGEAPSVDNDSIDVSGLSAVRGSSSVYVLKKDSRISVKASDGNGSGVETVRIQLGDGVDPVEMKKSREANGYTEFTYTVSAEDINGRNKKIPVIFEAEDKMSNRSSVRSSDNKGKYLFVIDDEKPVSSIANISDRNSYFPEGDGDNGKLWFRNFSDIVLSLKAEDVSPDICSGLDKLCITLNGQQSVIPLTGSDYAIDTDKLAAGGYTIVFSGTDDPDRFGAELKGDGVSVPLNGDFSLMEGKKLEVAFHVTDIAGNDSISHKQAVYIDNTAPKIIGLMAEGQNRLDSGTKIYEFFAGHAVRFDVITSGGEYSGIQYAEAVFLDPDGRVLSTERIMNNGGLHSNLISIPVPENFKGSIEVTAVNNVGGSSDKAASQLFITESSAKHSDTSQAEISLPDTPFRDKEGNKLYKDDINAKLTVRDSFSGIKGVNYSAEGAGSGAYSLSEALDNGWSIPENGSEKNLVTEISKDIELRGEANGRSISLGFEDNAGNTLTEAVNDRFSIDRTPPRVEIVFADEEKTAGQNSKSIFSAPREAVIRVTERNFDPERMKVTVNGTEEKLQWVPVEGTEDTDSPVYTASRKFESDGEYELKVNCTDRCDWESNSCDEKFIIDMTAPVLTESFDNSITNDHYYNKAVTASFTIKEQNFDPALIEVTGTFNGSANGFPAFSEWSRNGENNTSTVKFDSDGEYTVRISGKDKAGNVLETYVGKFCIDSRKPSIASEDIISTSNAKEIRPRILFEDTNIDKESIKIKVDGANRGNNLNLGGQLNEIAGGYEYVFDNIPDKEENDDIYKVKASAKDNADNKIEKDFRFAVNRYGSVFELDQDTRSIRGRFVPNEQDIIIVEKNPDRHSTPQNVYITKDNEMIELKEGVDYSVETVGGDDEWMEYTYTVFAKNFERDARYSVSIHSRDEAGNLNISSSEKKNADIDFCIDKTKPLCIPLNITENTAYKNDKLTAHLAVSDNIMLKTVKVFIDGKEVRSRYFDDECQFEISNSSHAQDIRVVLTDMAENQIEYNYKNILVTTSAMRILVHKTWFKVCCGAAALLAGAAAVLIKRRKKRLY